MGWSVELQIFRFNFRNFFLGMIEENAEAQHIPVFGYNTVPSLTLLGRITPSQCKSSNLRYHGANKRH